MSTIKQIILNDGRILKKNDSIVLTIEDMSETGEGIGKADGYTFFVKNALVGDIVEAHITKLLKNYGYARANELVKASENRVEPVCKKARPCGGCQLQELSYEGQLAFKHQKVKSHMERIAGIKDVEVLPVKGMEEPYYYRNKSQYPVQRGKDGRIVMGFYAGRTHDVIEMEDCMLNLGKDKEILEIVKEWMQTYQIEPYDEKTQAGVIRHVMIRYGKYTGQMMVCLVVTREQLEGNAREELVKRLLEVEGMTSICLNVNKEKTNVILGNKMVLLYGKDYIVDKIGEVSYRISAQSFYQVNPMQTKVLYEIALEYAGLTGNEVVWDLYCGIGTISLFLAQKAKKVYGVEIVEPANENANENAKLNGMENVEFFCGKAEEVLPREYKEHQIYADVIVTDPPRKGCDEKVIETMVQMKPKRIVYVSCNSATLARDCKMLEERGYKVEKIQPVDMFPQTTHVETIVKLSQRKPDDVVEVDLDLDELDITSAETKATYNEIKQYVLEQTGLRVTNLYIAQVKQKCGIIERENYNKPKSENSKQPKCTPEKEVAILDALKHFNMI
jgi:23S rRNA (uracil1939-C5)-methyltransferase